MLEHLERKKDSEKSKKAVASKHVKHLTKWTPPKPSKKDHSAKMDARKDVHKPKTARSDMSVNKEVHHRNQK